MKILKTIFLLLISFVFLFAISFNFRHEISNEISLLKPVSISSPILTPTSIPTIKTSFSFAVISDIHSSLPSLEKTLIRIKIDNIDFIIVTGDLTTLGKPSELHNIKTILDKSGIEYYAIPGNHDLWSVMGTNNPFREEFGVDYQSFFKNKVKFILINNGDGIIGIDQQQEIWLDKEINDCPKVYCLIFAHMPLNNLFTTHIMGEDNRAVASQAANLVKKFNNYKVYELFSGHVHYLGEYILDGLKTYTTGVIYSENSSSVANFLEVTVNLSEFRLEKKEVWLKY